MFMKAVTAKDSPTPRAGFYANAGPESAAAVAFWRVRPAISPQGTSRRDRCSPAFRRVARGAPLAQYAV